VNSVTQHLLETFQLGCTRGDRTLFTDVSLALGPGALLHVTGSNGSGKTTLLRTLCGLSQPAAGEIRWSGAPIVRLGDEYRARLAYIGHQDGVHGELTPFENLRLAGCLGERAEPAAILTALERLGLAAVRDFTTKLLSQGQRRRLALARLLVSPRPLWILDEPFSALDTRSSRLVETLLHEHAARGGCAVLSSHQELRLQDVRVMTLDLDTPRTADADARKPTQRSAARVYPNRP